MTKKIISDEKYVWICKISKYGSYIQTDRQIFRYKLCKIMSPFYDIDLREIVIQLKPINSKIFVCLTLNLNSIVFDLWIQVN